MTEQSFVEAAEGCQRLLYHVAYTILRHDRDCEDAVQEALLRAWRKRDSLKDESMFRCWITRIVSNTCYTMLKRKKRFSAAEMLNETQEIENGGIENQELHDAVGRLPMDIRLAIVLHYLEGFSTKEIAELTRRPEGTVRNRLYRGRQQLKDMLGEEMTL